jgi:arylsulfatase A-like enzyme
MFPMKPLPGALITSSFADQNSVTSPTGGIEVRLAWRGTLAMVGLAVIAGSEPQAHGRLAAETPNILIIVTDDHRRKAGYSQMAELDLRFQQQGTKFTHALATTPLCCPSRASIMTGQYTHNHGVWGNDPTAAPFLKWRAPEEMDHDITIQRYLHNAGYRTALFGKYLNKYPMELDPPHFDTWAYFTNSDFAYHDGTWNVDGQMQNVAGYHTDYIGDRAVEFIETTEQPWLLYLATAAPHAPYEAQAKYEDADVGSWKGNPATEEADRSDKPGWVKDHHATEDRGREVRKKQIRTLYSVDDLMGRVFAALDAAGETDMTLAFFIGDNGYTWAEHGIIDKRSAYRQSVRIPFFIRWPGHFDQGKDSRLVGTIDLLPTILEAVGVTAEHTVDGRSLLGAYGRTEVLLEFAKDKGVPTWASIYTKDYQFIQIYRDDGEVSFREYYDFDDDKWQLENLLHNGNSKDNPDTGPLIETLEAAQACAGASCP